MKKKILIPIIIGGAVLIGLILFLILRSSNDSYYNIEILDTIGKVNISRDNKYLDAFEGMKMRNRDFIRVGSDGFTRINCDRDTYSHLEHDTEASFIADSDNKLTINLTKGELVVEVQRKLNDDETFSVKTPNTTLAIRGTVIAVRTYPTADGGTETINYCLEGQAVVETADGITQTLDAGEGLITVTDDTGSVIENTSAGAKYFEFDNIDINSLKGADDNPMIVSSSNKIPTAGDIEINDENFPDIIFRFFIMDKIDLDDNGILSSSELAIEKIDVESSGITDLKGIEFFQNLTYLDCDTNFLKKLDLSYNTKLKNLYCKENAISELNIINCTELEYIDCGHNFLSELDISNNSKLSSVICQNNQLNGLDLSNNPNLITLACGNNVLPELDFSNNPKLDFMDCSNNLITKIDISKNSVLTALFCPDNFLTEIDISNNKMLRFFYVGSNKLTKIDVSNNTELTDLSCYSNYLTDIDISKNTKLQILSCSQNSLTELNVTNNPELLRLDFSFNSVTQLDLSKNPLLIELKCMYNELETLDVSKNPDLEDILYDIGKTNLIE